MSSTELHCPNCGFAIPLTEALSQQIRAEIESGLQATHQQALLDTEEKARREAEAALATRLHALQAEIEERARLAREAESRELELARKTVALEEAQRTLAERIRMETEEKLRKETETRVRALVEEATTRARSEAGLELSLARQQFAEQQAKLAEAQKQELVLRQQAAQLEERARDIDLQIARQLAEEKRSLEESLRRAAAEEQALKLAEKDKQVDDLKKLIEEMRRKSEQGSQELQGEVLELDIQESLERFFPLDNVAAVPKGVAGADVIQTVCNGAAQACGSIVWETKNTKHWQSGWIAKLKDDQRAVGANLAVLVSVTLPEEIHGFGRIDGVWVASLAIWPALAAVLREQLIHVAFAHAASESKNEKMELLYRYLAGDQFRGRVQGIVEAFDAMHQQIASERKAFEKQWREREKQLERVMLNTTGLYGEMRGIVGSSLADVPALSLDGVGALLEDDSE